MHHAYLLIGTLETVHDAIPVEDRTFDADVVLRTYATLSIADARELKHAASLRPVARDCKVFVLVCTQMTAEAQNALLKLFEEPNTSTRFYLIVARDELLIPTLRSRLMDITPARVRDEAGTLGVTFLRQSYRERLEEIASRMKEKDVAWGEALLCDLELWSAASAVHTGTDLLLVRSYYSGQSASKKMLLEHLALSLPVVSEIR